MNQLAPRHVSIKDPFWTPRLTVNASKAIFHQWEQLEATRCIDNFRIAAGEKQGFRDLLGLKAWALWRTDSVAVLGSLADTSLDLVASIVTLLGVHWAAQPADEQHRFGHGKAEALASLFQVTLITIAALGLAWESTHRLLSGVHQTTGAGEGIGVSLIAIVLSLTLVLYQKRVIARTGSLAIGTDNLHYQSDFYLNASVIVALVLDQYLGVSGVDPLFGIGIAAWLAWNALHAASDAVDHLMDKEWSVEERQHFLEVAASAPVLARGPQSWSSTLIIILSATSPSPSSSRSSVFARAAAKKGGKGSIVSENFSRKRGRSTCQLSTRPPRKIAPTTITIGGWQAKSSRTTEDMTEAWEKENEIVAEIAPQQGDIIVHKQKPSAFFGTPLMSMLNQVHADSLLVTGTTTSGCVRASVIDAFSYNLKVSVVEECVFDRGQASHQINLFDMAMKYADVIPLKDAIDYIRGLPDNLFAPAL